MAKATSAFQKTPGYQIIDQWLSAKGFYPFAFQQEAWQHINAGKSGLVNAPTGCGKTFSVFLGALIQFINQHPKDYKTVKNSGMQLLWLTPLRALAKDIGRAMEQVIFELDMQWRIGIRNGDTDTSERQKQKRSMPEVLIITPESLHLLLAQKEYPKLFETLQMIAIDEWHELLGSKRGVLVELALSRIVNCDISDIKSDPAKPKIKRIKGAKIVLEKVNHVTRETADVSGDGDLKNVKIKEEPEGVKVKSEEDDVSAIKTLQNAAPKRNKTTSKLTTDNLQLTPEQLTIFAPQLQITNQPSKIKIWGISATIGNLEQAMEVLLSPLTHLPINKTNNGATAVPEPVIVKAKLDKKIHIESVLPDEIERYPWAGHLGLYLAEKIIPIIEQSVTTLIFINTRGMSERWYQKLLDIAPQFAGAIALHHGSIEHELRTWVEEALHTQKLKAVVCTASLDLGVDFRPVDTVIQVGSPKGVARFLQRAGRSGHGPGETSKIYFLPTHSLELVEAAALKDAVDLGMIESREPMMLCFDVLTQYLCTLAIGEGFIPDTVFNEVKSTHCFRDITLDEWHEILRYITIGGNALQQYDEYRKVEVQENGLYKIKNRRIAMRHRMHIGAIVSDAMLKVKFMQGGFIGMIEEYFISRLEPGDVFTLAGRNLELVGIKDMHVNVKKSNSKKSIVPSWNGGRMPLSANLGVMLRKAFNNALNPKTTSIELKVLKPLFLLQQQLSHIPKAGELLIEQIETKDGYHLFVYPFEGRLVHEAMAALLAYRISLIRPITFSIAMNDYGFELLSDQPVPVDDTNAYDLFTTTNLLQDIQTSVNSVEMARRKFRDVAVIGGLIFQGYPGEHKKARHLQASASLLFNVFSEYDPHNLLLRQAYQEVFDQQMEEVRLRNALQRIQTEQIIITFPTRLTPFCFPIKVDSMRENLTSEKLEDRIARMQAGLED